jgi:hypothetical protein
VQGYLWDPSDAPRLNDRKPEDLFGAPVYYADWTMPIACMHCSETPNKTTGDEYAMGPWMSDVPPWSEGIEGDVEASLEHQGTFNA